ncbi:MAG: hypothetical protein ACKVXR_10360 [Planctomycetota bacterium]
MRPRLDTSFLLLEGRRALFLVHRAADGWLALDLAGPVTDRFAPGIAIVRGGESFLDRIFPLYMFDRDPVEFGGLRVPGPSGARYGVGGAVDRLLLTARGSPGTGPRLRFFRGASRIPCRSRALPEGAILVRATPELVFETRPDSLWERAACFVGSGTSPPRTSR